MKYASLRAFLIVLALLVPVAHAVVRPTESAAPANGMIRLQPVASGLSQPLDIAHAGDGSKRLFVVEKTGAVKIIQNGAVVATPFLDLSALVSRGDEQGLLGIAFHPRYRENGQFFVNYTDISGNTVIARYRVSASNANVADAASAQVILAVPQPFANHNGGKLAFWAGWLSLHRVG